MPRLQPRTRISNETFDPRKTVLVMKNPPRQLCSLSLDAATKRDPLTSMLSRAAPVAIGLLCFYSVPAFAGETSSESTLRSYSAPPPTILPSDPEAPLTREQGRAYYDRFVTGDWGGYRTLLHNRGIDFNLDYFGEMAGNLHGGNDRFSGYPKGNVSPGVMTIKPRSE
jgi:hypothetical protein